MNARALAWLACRQTNAPLCTSAPPSPLCRTKTPEEGTLAIKHCLFAATPAESGHYLGSDAIRSPLHFMRNPGEPAYDGVLPPF